MPEAQDANDTSFRIGAIDDEISTNRKESRDWLLRERRSGVVPADELDDFLKILFASGREDYFPVHERRASRSCSPLTCRPSSVSLSAPLSDATSAASRRGVSGHRADRNNTDD